MYHTNIFSVLCQNCTSFFAKYSKILKKITQAGLGEEKMYCIIVILYEMVNQ